MTELTLPSTAATCYGVRRSVFNMVEFYEQMRYNICVQQHPPHDAVGHRRIPYTHGPRRAVIAASGRSGHLQLSPTEHCSVGQVDQRNRSLPRPGGYGAHKQSEVALVTRAVWRKQLKFAARGNRRHTGPAVWLVGSAQFQDIPVQAADQRAIARLCRLFCFPDSGGKSDGKAQGHWFYRQ